VQLGFVRMSEGAKLTDRGQRKRGEAAVSLLRRTSVFFVDQHDVGGDACSPDHGRSAGLFRIDFNELAPSPIHALSYAYYLANKIVVITSAPEVPMNLQQYLIDAQSTCRKFPPLQAGTSISFVATKHSAGGGSCSSNIIR